MVNLERGLSAGTALPALDRCTIPHRGHRLLRSPGAGVAQAFRPAMARLKPCHTTFSLAKYCRYSPSSRLALAGRGIDHDRSRCLAGLSPRTARRWDICPIYEVGEDGDELFIVMELLEGETLADRPPNQVKRLGAARPRWFCPWS